MNTEDTLVIKSKLDYLTLPFFILYGYKKFIFSFEMNPITYEVPVEKVIGYLVLAIILLIIYIIGIVYIFAKKGFLIGAGFLILPFIINKFIPDSLSILGRIIGLSPIVYAIFLLFSGSSSNNSYKTATNINSRGNQVIASGGRRK